MPFRPSYDSNGKSIPGAQIWFTLAGTNTPAAIYEDEALTTPSANPVIANGVGRIPSTYLADGVDYRVRVYEPDAVVGVDTPLEEYDPYEGMFSDVLLPSDVREVLTADRTYYVRTDGSDANDGLTDAAGGAFATIQKAINVSQGTLDLDGHKVTIRVGDGTYGAVVLGGLLVGGADPDGQPLEIIGNETTPANVVLTSSANYTVTVTNYAYVLMAGLTIANTGNSGLLVERGGFFEHRNLVFGAATDEKILAQHHGVVRAIGPTTVAGNSTNFAHATKRSIIDFASQTLTFSGAPVFSNYLWGINDASINLDSGTIVGTASGKTIVHDNGILNVSSMTGSYLGGVAPAVDDGGIIAAADKTATRAFYVRPGGSDANDGLANTDSRAFKTIQGAINAVSKLAYNPIAWHATSGIVIQVAAGTYAETVSLKNLQHPNWAMLIGDETTPGNVVVQGVTDGVTALNLKTQWYVRGLRIHASSGSSLRVEGGSQVIFRKVEFGTASGSHIFALNGGVVTADGDYAIVAAAGFHVRPWANSVIDIKNQTITISGTPAFATAFADATRGGLLRASGMTFSGSATGVRYTVSLNGVMDVGGGGAAYLPGNAAGSTATGGQYA